MAVFYDAQNEQPRHTQRRNTLSGHSEMQGVRIGLDTYG